MKVITCRHPTTGKPGRVWDFKTIGLRVLKHLIKPLRSVPC